MLQWICGSMPPGMTIWSLASTVRAAPTDSRLPGAPMAAILPPATPISAACAPVGMTAVPPVTSRSSTPASLAGTVILIVFPLPAADAQLRAQCRARAVQFRVRVQSRLIGPAFQQCKLVGVEHAPEDLELLAAGLFHAFLAPALHHLRELAALAGCGGDRHDQSYGHLSLSALVGTNERVVLCAN